MPELARSWMKWLSMSLSFLLLLLFVWHHWSMERGLLPLAAAQASYGAGFALCAVFLLGLLARLQVTAYPAVWRMLTVLLGAGLAALEIALHSYAGALFLALWAPAVIGVSVVSMAARYSPSSLLNFWLGKQQHDESA
jgi:glucan phosphoethanolaminetransferase (alkaline phosphatase superfamily)